MPIASAAQLREYLDQVPVGAGIDARLEAILSRAESIVTEALGFTFAEYGAASTKRVQSETGTWLRLPPYQQGSITTIYPITDSTPSTTALSDYEERWESGRFYLYRDTGWGSLRYDVTAIFGFGPAPASIVELVLELAVNIWRSRDKGLFTEIIGADGGGQVRYVGGLNSQQRMIIANVRRQYQEAVT